MEQETWTKNIPIAITVADRDGKICFMNDKSISTFNNSGGDKLIGSDLSDCHSDSSNIKIQNIIDSNTPNCYTIDKNGKKKLIYQAPIFDNNIYAGIVEISIELPENMPHFVRK